MLCVVTDDEAAKAQVFASFANAHAWKVEVRRITHRDYPGRRYRQAGWTVIARRGADRHRNVD